MGDQLNGEGMVFTNGMGSIEYIQKNFGFLSHPVYIKVNSKET